jgi:hypothetical protein
LFSLPCRVSSPFSLRKYAAGAAWTCASPQTLSTPLFNRRSMAPVRITIAGPSTNRAQAAAGETAMGAGIRKVMSCLLLRT